MEHGHQGYLVHPATSPERFAEALSPLLDNADLRAQMAAEGRRTALEQYGWPRIAEMLETYYSDLVAGRRPTWASAKSSASS
jgi:glycosyltransferase involved in cell wall biosynthesis